MNKSLPPTPDLRHTQRSPISWLRVAQAICVAWGLILFFIWLPQCGGELSQRFVDEPDAGIDAAFLYDAHNDPDGTTNADASNDINTPDAKDALPDYYDPGCPDAPAPQEQYECDPFDFDSKWCGTGNACYPFVEPPAFTCDQEVFGAKCAQAGFGVQGESCDYGCAANHICVVSGQGTQCVHLCNPNELNPCADGRVCEEVDIPGIGGCI